MSDYNEELYAEMCQDNGIQHNNDNVADEMLDNLLDDLFDCNN